MNEQKTKQRLFDVKEFREKARTSLENLSKTQQPGEHAGKGTKTDVLESVKNDILELMSKGYTPKQIADAFSNDVFAILPKTITQLVNSAKTTKIKRTKKATGTGKTAVKPTNTTTTNDQQAKKSSAFTVTKDTEDL